MSSFFNLSSPEIITLSSKINFDMDVRDKKSHNGHYGIWYSSSCQKNTKTCVNSYKKRLLSNSA